MKIKTLVLFIILLLTVFSCNKKNEDDVTIRKVLGIRKIALEEGDFIKYKSIISDDYFDKKKNENKDRVLNKFKGIIANTIDRKLNFSDITIYFDKQDNSRATVVEKIYLEVVMKNGKKKYLKSKEKIDLIKDNEGWKIAGGL